MIYNEDCIKGMKRLADDSVDLIVTDPPYGMSFMGKHWDKALPPKAAFEQMLRVLKPGAFAFVMCAPRSDLQARMSILLEDAGFNIAFTPIYWTFATGFPKAQNISKQIDKRNGRNSYKEIKEYLNKQRKLKGYSFKQINEMLGVVTNGGGMASNYMGNKHLGNVIPTKEMYYKLKVILELDNRYDELIEIEEAEREVIGTKSVGIKNGAANGSHEYGLTKPEVDITKDATPEAEKYNGAYAGYQPKPAVEVVIVAMKPKTEKTYVDQVLSNGHGVTWLDECRINERFPANLLVSDDSLNETYSRYFDLDAWFAIFPKPAKSEKGEGNTHPTVKPIKLMSYLITLGSRPGEVILDPFMGSGTTGISAKLTRREFIGFEMEEEYFNIAEARIDAW